MSDRDTYSRLHTNSLKKEKKKNPKYGICKLVLRGRNRNSVTNTKPLNSTTLWNVNSKNVHEKQYFLKRELKTF